MRPSTTRFFGVRLRMTAQQGFSLLEMVIAIFIIAMVLALSLVAMGKGMVTSAKSSDVAIAAAIAEQEMARIKNIPFPPTTYDGQVNYTTKETKTNAEQPYNNDFEVQVLNNSFDADFASVTSDDATMLRKITVKVYRKRDGATLATLYTYIARNGTI